MSRKTARLHFIIDQQESAMRVTHIRTHYLILYDEFYERIGILDSREVQVEEFAELLPYIDWVEV